MVYLHYSICDSYHSNNPGIYLNRREFPIDFPVWHNRDDVVMGKDAVVEKALDWINNVVYPDSTFSDKTFYTLGEDSVHISTIIENPNSHQLLVGAYLKTLEGTLIDSVDFVKQTLDTEPEQWIGNFSLPMAEEFYKISVTSFDATASEQFTLPNATRFTTVPLLIDSVQTAAISNFRYTFKPFLKNPGTVQTIKSIVVKIICNDSWVTTIFPAERTCINLIPGQIAGTLAFAVSYDSASFPGYFNLRFSISSDGWSYWEIDTTIIVKPTDVEEETSLPLAYKLEQNFPNPWNPVTTIGYVIKEKSKAKLTVFNTIGEEVAVLVNEEQDKGYHKVVFDASKLSSGVYFYKLTAGNFISTRKMMLLK